MRYDENLSSNDNLKSYYCSDISCLLEKYGFHISVYICREPNIGINEDNRYIKNYSFRLSHLHINGKPPNKDRIQAGKIFFYYLLSDANRIVTDETGLRFKNNRFHHTNWWLN